MYPHIGSFRVGAAREYSSTRVQHQQDCIFAIPSSKPMFCALFGIPFAEIEK